MKVKRKLEYKIFMFLCVFVACSGSYASTINVTSGAVDTSNNGNCSLIEAIMSADSDTSVDGCNAGSGKDEIVLSSSVYSLPAVVDGRFGFNGTPCINSDVVILGNGATVSRGASDAFRLFCVDSSGSLALRDITLSNGFASGPSLSHRRGGAVLSMGGIELLNVTVEGSDAVVQGGGLFINGGSASVVDSKFNANSADTGGAIRGDAGATIQISNSEFRTNTAIRGAALFINDANAIIRDSLFENNESELMGGGVYFSGATVELLDSRVIRNKTVQKGGGVRIDDESKVVIRRTLVAGNEVTDVGGGIHVIKSELDVIDSTISNNIAGRGAGLYVDVAHANVINTTLSGNVAEVFGGAMYLDADVNLAFGNASATLSNSSLINNRAPQGAGGLWMNPISKANMFNTVIAKNTFRNCAGPGIITVEENNWFDDEFCSAPSNGDPMVGDLSDNGGPTQTHALLRSSPLIDAGFSAKCTQADQRGIVRPQGAGCDIGAFELRLVGNTDISTLIPAIFYLLDE